MRAGLIAALLVCITTSWLAQVEATACASICYTTDLTGFGTGGTAGCSCSGSGAIRTGSDSCQCGQCYLQQSGAVIGYAISSDGTCAYGTDCGDCDYSSDASGSSTSASASASSSSTTTPTPTPSAGSASSTDAPTTSSPAASDSSPSTSSAPSVASNDSSSTAAGSSSSSSDNNNAGGTAGSGASTSSSNGGLATWQIALIICCGVLVFTVAVVSVLSCYCKARNRLYENEDAQADVSYYHQPYPGTRDHIVIGDGAGAAAGAAAGAGAATPSLFAQAPNSSRSQQRRSGSFTNDLKPLYSNSSQTNNPDRIGLGLAPVHTRSSSGDLAGSYPNERRPSASNRSIGRRPSLEQQYSARDRDSLAVEL